MLMLASRYGLRTFALWGTAARWQNCKEALASIGRVVADVTDRLSVEFRPSDLYASFVAFDLHSWQAALRPEARSSTTSGSGMAAPSRDAGRNLVAAARRLCEGAGVVYDGNTWRAAVRVALAERDRIVAARPHGAPPSDGAQGQLGERTKRPSWRPAVEGPDNRLVWRRVLDAGAVEPALGPAIRFYLAAWDGTGAVERGLGQDASIVQQHVGSRARTDEGQSLYSALLEVKLEGPQREQDMFTQSEDSGTLLLMDFSRACASQWLLEHGRRFTCSTRARRDQGQPLPRRGVGTDSAVQHHARAAYAALSSMAMCDARPLGEGAPARKTIFGVDRARLMLAVNDVPVPQPGKKTANFRKATERKAATKRSVGVWTGCLGAPALRLGGASAVRAASKAAAMQGARAKLWLTGKPRGRKASTASGLERSSGQSVATSSWLARAARATVRLPRPRPAPFSASTRDAATRTSEVAATLEEMYRGEKEIDSADLRTWLQAIALGEKVRRGSATFHHVHACRGDRSIVVSEDFQKKHRSLAQALKTIAKRPGSRWKVVGEKPRNGAHFCVDNKKDFVQFLMDVRLSRDAGASTPGGRCAEHSR